jgi:hypothetical protein
MRNVRIAAVDESLEESVKERDLHRHLSNGTQKDEGTPGNGGSRRTTDGAQDSDYELHEALNMLKGMVLLQERSGR